ncbi:hypothetical protein KC19_1G308100 [Ceratodon purpureus]|uniref:Uncharacterized protein n=1 Tax=Ceratodon purpureus TaxID=3225 RepID=A0A8T0JCT9_CERPU|nr:hypothetical protein KC19_1G308100 [Ceratodon purpureus]
MGAHENVGGATVSRLLRATPNSERTHLHPWLPPLQITSIMPGSGLAGFGKPTTQLLSYCFMKYRAREF